MAARAIASLTLSFGLVSIPVKLYSATQASGAVSFNLLHKGCGSRLRQQYLCQREGVVVERADMVKGYEFAKDQYVVFTPEELKEMAFDDSVAEKSFTGMETSPNETVSDAMDRAAMFVLPVFQARIPILDQEDASCHSGRF